MGNSIFEGNIGNLCTSNDGEAEVHEKETFAGEVVDTVFEDTAANVSRLSELLSRMKSVIDDTDEEEDSMDADDEDEEDDAEENNMSADDYHNKAVECACFHKFKRSAEICMNGLKRFPLNVDLLADTIKYSADIGDLDIASKYYYCIRLVFKVLLDIALPV